MALKDFWKAQVDGQDDASAEIINAIAEEVIITQDNVKELEKKQINLKETQDELSDAISETKISENELRTAIDEIAKEVIKLGENEISVSQSTGQSENVVMSQKAVTKELNSKYTLPQIWNNIPLEVVQDAYWRNGSAANQSAWSYAILSVKEGETYKVTCRGNGYVSAYNFCDDSLTVLSKSSESAATDYIGAEIVIPEGCAYLVLNTQHYVTPFSAYRLDYIYPETSMLNGSTIVNFGDSIFGNYRPPVDISSFISDYTGAIVYNCGFGGCYMSVHPTAPTTYGAFSMCSLADAVASGDFTAQDTADNNANWTSKPSYYSDTLALLKSIDFSKVDIITIAYGTNDFYGNKVLDGDAETDVNTYAGALRHSIETILTAYPHIRIFVCSQIYRAWLTSGFEFIEDSDTLKNTNGAKLTDFVEKTKEIASDYKLPFIDNYFELGFNKFNRSRYFPSTDGTHPNENGRLLIAKHIVSKLF